MDQFCNTDDPKFSEFVRSVLDEERELETFDSSSETEDNIEIHGETDSEQGELTDEEENEVESSTGSFIKSKNGHIWSLEAPKRFRTPQRNIIKVPLAKNRAKN